MYKPSNSGLEARDTFLFMVRARRLRYAPNRGKVAMVASNLGFGGSERQMVAVAAGLIARGHPVSVLALDEVGPGIPSFEGHLMEIGVEVEVSSRLSAEQRRCSRSTMQLPETDKVPEWLFQYVVNVGSHIERHRPEALHCWLDHPSIYGGFAGCVLGVPRILLQLGSTSTIFRRNVLWSGFWRQAYLAIASNASVKITNNSNAGARDYEQWIGLPEGSIGSLYNGFFPASVRSPSQQETAELRSSLNLPDNVVIVGTLMRLVPEKDPHLWLDTVVEVLKTRHDVHFLIFGYGPLEQEIMNRLENSGLRKAVTLGGPTGDPGLAYSLMDIVLFTSSVEGIPNVAIEAQASGKPVVAPDVGGLAEAIVDGLTGIVARPRSPASLANAITEIIDNRAWREAVESEGPKLVQRRFGLDRMVNETIRYLW